MNMMQEEHWPTEHFRERKIPSFESNTFYSDGHIRLDFMRIDSLWRVTAWSTFTKSSLIGVSKVRSDLEPNQFAMLRASIEAIRDLYRSEFRFGQ